MSPKARSTVRPFSIAPGASPAEEAHARGLNEGMRRKVNRIQQEVSKRHTLAQRLVKKIGLRDKRIAELERALARVKDDLVEINLFSDTEEERVMAKDLLDRMGSSTQSKRE